MADLLARPGQASDYINSRLRAGSAPWWVTEGSRAWSYYKCCPYPSYTPTDSPMARWNVAEEGPYPTCFPAARFIVDTSADFLFQEPPTLTVKSTTSDTAGKDLTDFLADVWRMNAIPGRLREEAVKAGNEGSTILKFAFTPENQRRPIAVHWMSPSEVSFFHDPLDADILTSVRVLFKYADQDGKWWWYREDWDAVNYTVYYPSAADEYSDALDVKFIPQEGFPAPNPFSPIIPFTKIYNLKEAGQTEGCGDLWGLWGVLDRLNYQYWLWGRSSQLDGDPIWVAINASGPIEPPKAGAVTKISGQGADFKAVEALGMQAPYRIQLIDHLNHWLMDAASSVRLDSETISNKGNLTRNVVELLHRPIISLTDRKRTNWGESGLELFAENLLEGLSRHPDAVTMFGVLSAVDPDDPETFDCEIAWPSMFTMGEDERSAGLANIAVAETNGYLTREMAIKMAVGYWDDLDENEVVAEILKAFPENPLITAAATAAMNNQQTKDRVPGETQQQPAGAGALGKPNAQ